MNSDLSGVVAAARRMTAGVPVVLVFADRAYGRILDNWLRHVAALNVPNILVCALDAETLRLAHRRRVASVCLPPVGSRSELWSLRVEVFAALAEVGIDFVHSDADAVWVQSPLHSLSNNGSDLVFSQGTIWPRDVVECWGFVLCCGFFGVRATESARHFLQEVVGRVRSDADDQVSVNRALIDMGIDWDLPPSSASLVHKGIAFQTYERAVVGRAGGLRVAMLPFADYPRVSEFGSGAVVAHPLIDRAVEGMEQGLARAGLWRLPTMSGEQRVTY